MTEKKPLQRPPAAKFVLAGFKNEWDLAKCPEMKRLDSIKDRDIYGVSLVTVMPVERFQVVDAAIGWSRRYYPQGNGALPFTRALEGDEHRGHGKNWELETVRAGTEISLYFAPEEGSFAWTAGPLDSNFGMPRRGEGGMTADDIWAATHFELVGGGDTLSKILLMAADPRARVTIACFRLLPCFMMWLLMLWIQYSARNQMTVSFYQHGILSEWINVCIMYVAVILPKLFEMAEPVGLVREVFELATKVHDNPQLANGLRFAAAFELVNLMQPVCAFALSLYVAIFLAENVFLNVILNIVALEFVAEVDDDLIAAYTDWRFGENSALSVALLDITYAVHEENDFWNESDTAKARVQEALKRGEISNAMRWQLLTSSAAGLGLIGELEDGRECVKSFQMHVDVINWATMPERQLVKEGGLYLAATTNFTWENNISKKKRALLFKHFPSLALKFPWFGCMQVSRLGLGQSHGQYLVDVINANDEVVELNAACNELGDDTVAVLRDGLGDNKTLKKLSLCDCQLTDAGAVAFAELLRSNTTLEYCWLMDNKGIGDVGALSLAASLTKPKGDGDGDDANSTLRSLYMRNTGVSVDCQKKCIKATNGRMEFH